MNLAQDPDSVRSRSTGKGFLGLFVMFAVTALILRFVFSSAEYYGDQVGLARYCGDPVATIDRVKMILASDIPSDGNERRPYIVAAKLLYLVPQLHDETIEAYSVRLLEEIEERCR